MYWAYWFCTKRHSFFFFFVTLLTFFRSLSQPHTHKAISSLAYITLSHSHRPHSLLATFSEITGDPNLCFNTPNTCNYPFNIFEIFSVFVRSPSQKVMFSNLDMLSTCCVLFAISIYAMTQISQSLRTNNIWYSFRQLDWRDSTWKIWWRHTRSHHCCTNGKKNIWNKTDTLVQRKKRTQTLNVNKTVESREPIVWEGEKMYNLPNDRLWMGRWERICVAFSLYSLNFFLVCMRMSM